MTPIALDFSKGTPSPPQPPPPSPPPPPPPLSVILALSFILSSVCLTAPILSLLCLSVCLSLSRFYYLRQRLLVRQSLSLHFGPCFDLRHGRL